MRLSDFNYYLPPQLIAQVPAVPRDSSRLLIVKKKSSIFSHRHFFEIVNYFSAGDVLILNDSKVIPARLKGKKRTGGRVEIFLSKRLTSLKNSEEIWECLVNGRYLKPGIIIKISSSFQALLKEKQGDVWVVEFQFKNRDFFSLLKQWGQAPLPPYIKTEAKAQTKNYQTVYANDKHAGSVAAPTAGLHFTPQLLRALKKRGVIIKTITLHVGLGTFLPIRVQNVTKHEMHSEWAEISKEVMASINMAHRQKKKVIAVGTTTTRALEAAYQINTYQGYTGWVNIFIYPPFNFKVINGLITNFHLPESTLLLLVSALAGRKKILQAYEEAIQNNYRFYSFGDAMLILA